MSSTAALCERGWGLAEEYRASVEKPIRSSCMIRSSVVNGVMSNISNDVNLTKLGISGAYFSIRNVNYVSNVAYAAANIGNGTDITIMGTVTSGDVTFTAGTSGLTVTIVDDAVYSAGIVTLDGSTIEIAVGGTLSGTVTAAAGDSTASVEFSKLEAIGSEFTVESDVETTVDGDVDYLAINGNVNSGNVIIASGNVTASRIVVNSASTEITTQKGLLTIAEGATLSVPEQAELYIRANEDVTKTALSVAGTLDIDNAVTITGLADIAGTVNINDGASLIITKYNAKVGTVNVDGTIAVSDNENNRGNLIVGTENGEGILAVNGTVTGQVSIESNAAYIKAYETADLTGADIEWNYTTEESSAETTAFYINGQLYMTVYGTSASSVTIDTIVSNETYDMPGYDVGYKTGTNDEKGLYLYSNWYSTEGLNPGTEVENGDNLQSFDAVYAEVEVSDIIGTISEGTGLTMYIDGLTISNWMATIDGKYVYYLPVGTHTVSIAANAGYNADNAVITFNGQTISNGGTITIEAGATSFTLAASGAVPAQSVAPSGDSGDDGMSLTDILLIVLVVLILVMAIIVALRLMRS